MSEWFVSYPCCGCQSLSLFSCCQMAEHALSQELLWSNGGRSVSYLLHLAQLQILRADYCSAEASLKEALFHSNQVLRH